MIYTVSLENMEFKAYHGCYELEKVVGNRFRVDLTVDAELGEAAAADDVTRTVNYLDLYRTVAEQMACKSNILENVAQRIIDAVYGGYPNVVKVTVSVAKLAPPLGGKIGAVSVKLSK